MRNIGHVFCGLAVVVSLTNVNAQDGRSHGSCGVNGSCSHDSSQLPPLPPNSTRYLRPIGSAQATQAPRDEYLRGGATPCACCSSSSTATTSQNPGRPASTPVTLERLSRQLSATVRSELRDRRDIRDLQADTDDISRAAWELLRASDNRASDSTLLAEARRILAPMRRLTNALDRDDRARDSRMAVQDLERVLMPYGRALQSAAGERSQPVTQGSYPPIPSSQAPSRLGTVSIPAAMKDIALLPAKEQAAALRQQTCPVTKAPLGSMGKPIRVSVSGRSIYVCCQGCVNAVKSNPAKYLTQ